MSSNLVWMPVVPEDMNDLPDQLKFALRKRYNNPIDVVVRESALSYFQGLSDAGIDGADKIINAINAYGEIKIQEYFG